MNLDNRVKKLLGQVQNDLKVLLDGYKIKWENPEKFHLTLSFLGDFNITEIKSVIEEFGKIELGFEFITFKTNSIGFFPNEKYPNVVFADLIELTNNCSLLVEYIEKVILAFDIKPDKKFVPHVTLGRFRRDKRQKLEESVNIKVPETEINFDSFHLMKSSLKQFGSEYEEIAKFSFKKLSKGIK